MTEIKSIAEMQKKGFGKMYSDKLKEAIHNDWYFQGWEKILILVSFLWLCWSIGKWVLKTFA